MRRVLCEGWDVRDEVRKDLKGVRIGLFKDFDINELDEINRKRLDQCIYKLKDLGAEIIDNIEVDLLKYSLPSYYTLAFGEAASNLSRYDGIKYGLQKEIDGQDLHEYIANVRTQSFNKNVYKRLLLGNFILSSRYENYNEYFIKAQKIRRLLCQQVDEAYKANNLDFVFAPTTAGKIPKIKDFFNESRGAVEEYIEDVYTVFANLVGLPSINIPYDRDEDGMPTSFQLMGHFGEDYHLLRHAIRYENSYK